VYSGGECYIAVTGIDITERQRAELALAESEANFRTFCNSIHDFLFVLSMQGDILYSNDFVAARLNYSAAELLGQSVLMLHPPERREEAMRIVTEMLAGSATLCPVPLQAKGGQLIPVETRVVKGHWNGQAALFGLSHDMSESVRAEQALREQTQALARSNAELEQFAYVASHDLRQPLRMVNSYMQLLERALADKLDDDKRQMMHFASDGARRMDQMLVSLLEYSRVGRMGEPQQALASRAAVDEALRFLAPSIQEAQATVRVSGDWPQIVASPDEFTRLWQNLIGNAVKYCAPERAPEIDITVTPEPNDGWRFCVADNGIGIDPAQFDRLFKVFQRLHARDQYEGNGIGLAVARKIVERHGGRIWVESEGADKGSRFCFSLPKAPPMENSG
jgi:PAS domain S-box-containing protein